MNLRAKEFVFSNIRLILFGFFILLILLSISSFLIHKIEMRFEEMEKNRNIDQARGVVMVIMRDADNLAQLLAGWAYWEESADFLTGRKKDYFKDYFTHPVMLATELDAVAFYNREGNYAYSRRLTNKRDSVEEMPGSTLATITKALPGLIPEKINDFKWGLMETDQGVMILACRHVSDDRIKIPSQGYILFGRLLSDKELQNISTILGNTLSWRPESPQPKIKEGSIDTPDFGTLPVYRILVFPGEKSSSELCIEILLPDILHEPSLNLRVQIPRTYNDQARSTAQLINQVNIISILIISCFVFYLIYEIFKRHKAEHELQESLRFERSVSRLSQLFIQLPEDKLDHAINESLAILAEFIPSDFGFIFEFSPDYKTLHKTHHWHSYKYTPQLSFNEPVPTQGLESFIQKMKNGEVTVLNFKNDISPDTEVASYIFHKLRIFSCLTAPMREGDKLIGFIGFASMNEKQIWKDEEKRLLSTFAEILTLYIQRKKAQIQLRESEKNLFESALKDSELKSLKAQINPHFLFNSLNSLRALINENPDNARHAVTLLSNLLRASLRAGQEKLIRLEDEMIVVNAFLSLEQIRFEERLKVFTHISPECLDCLVPPMLIQTLAENAVKYGVEPYSLGGTVSIHASIQDHQLHLTVENTGQLAINPDSIQIGLTNAQERIRIIFGDAGSLKIYNSSSTTVIAEIMFPVVS